MSSTAIPLVADFLPGATIGWRAGTRVDVELFVGTAHALARRMPAGGYCINLCEDRLNFTLGLAAALMRRAVNLLPPARARGALRDLEAMYAPACAFVDQPDAFRGVRQIDLRDWPDRAEGSGNPAIDADQPAITLFTSGSTGAPRPHSKRWGALVAGARALRARLPLAAGSAILGTVPPQHMWGLEATVMLPLQSGCAIASHSPLLPADVAALLAEMTAPRWLVTVPMHLQACVAMDIRMPALGGILSATARLDARLAQAVEASTGAPVVEIYGSTETGAVATRRPSLEEGFELLNGLRLDSRAGKCRVLAGHVGDAVALPDKLEALSATRFTLGARVKDLVKIGGKRASLATLNTELGRVPGVVDGVFWLPENDRATQRLAAFVVAPGVARAAILAALRERIDPAFLPRPMILVDALPRDALGKLPRESLAELASRTIGDDATRTT
jgi:acyl-coenzyme A synthetase/AMP-(fatty) acid ligase